jgi:hypothetical protein
VRSISIDEEIVYGKVDPAKLIEAIRNIVKKSQRFLQYICKGIRMNRIKNKITQKRYKKESQRNIIKNK